MPYVELGFRHIFFDVAAPYDEETLERFVGEVKPMLEQAAIASARPMTRSLGFVVRRQERGPESGIEQAHVVDVGLARRVAGGVTQHLDVRG